jgi:FkbM family methyltransferase
MSSLAKLRLWMRRFRNGLSVRSAVVHRVAGRGVPKLAGVRLASSEPANAWALTLRISEGEYDFTGFAVRRGWRVLDVGANIGVFSLIASRRGAHIQAYEAGSANFACLVRNTVGRGVEAHHAAVVGRNGDARSVRLFLHSTTPSRHTLLGTEVTTGEKLEQWEAVPSVGLGELLAGSAFDLVKVDVEGAEYEMLANTPAELLRRGQRWIIESHHQMGDPARLLEAFQAAGFETRLETDPSAAISQLGGMVLASRP